MKNMPTDVRELRFNCEHFNLVIKGIRASYTKDMAYLYYRNAWKPAWVVQQLY